jgi:5-(carboxyamino)imidazole ribonucleotide synthase
VLGILGTGQLSMMLTEAAGPMGLKTLAYDGRLEDEAALSRFFAECSRVARAPTVIFENEFVDCDLLERAGKPHGVRFVPGLAAIRELQDKILQKRRLEQLGIPTAAWLPIGEGEEPAAFLARAGQRFSRGFVLKWARMGYDGKGVLVVGSSSSAAETFVSEAASRGIPVYAEEKIAFRRELAILSVYSTKGEQAHYPLVVSVQREGICRTVTGPATGLGVAEGLEKEAREAAVKLARSIDLFGAFALEFFETEAGQLLVNEIAPRVHNSAHYTQDSARTSQFENHLRAALGMPLGDTACTPAFAMVNLIGPPGASRLSLPASLGPGILHWYGKRDLRPGRKMGHLNGASESPEGLATIVNALEERRLKWESEQR